MLIDSDKIDARRFCGYPAYGASASGNAGWRFYQAYGELEYRLNNLAAGEEAVLARQLATLRVLESAIPEAAANLDTSKAAVWSHNPDEIRDRTELFDDWRRRFCAFLGVPPGPALATSTMTPALVI